VSQGPGRQRFLTLDGMRGLAALLIMVFHLHGLFGYLPIQSYLAVDLFFVLSGFVLAEAYGARLSAGLPWRSFLRIRLARFYPLYLLGTLLGALLAWLSPNPNWGEPWWALPFSLLMLPSPFTGVLFPFVVPAWSLFLELGINAAWAWLRRFLNTRALAWGLGLSAASLAAAGLRQAGVDPTGHWSSKGGLDAGYHWSLGQAWIAASRVAFSFGLGLLLHRLPRTRLPRLPPWLLLGLLGLLFCAPIPLGAAGRPWFDLGFALLASPALVLLGSASEPQSPWGQRLFARLGIISYPLYVLHTVVGGLLSWALHAFWGVEAKALAPWPGLALAAALVALCLWLNGHYDRPLRRRWSQNF
jgi:peptidoglycan/LPS O-acetylase OafA/YrhL